MKRFLAKAFPTRLFRMGNNISWSSNDMLKVMKISSYEEYQSYARSMREEYERRKAIELKLIGSDDAFYVSGVCHICMQQVSFYSDFMYAFVNTDGKRLPNWRERLVCPGCELNNRMRASIHVFQQICNPDRDAAIYLTEQTTPMFAWFSKSYPHVIGSEYLGNDVAKGKTNNSGVRCESILDLSFEDEKFDRILSFDVFEHIPHYQKAFEECFRCLRPSGTLFFTVPFNLNSRDHIIRARIKSDNDIEHLLPPEYHGDPLSADGCLCYYHFGWEMLDDLRGAGFSDVGCYFYWSDLFGYLGIDQFVFIAQKG